MKNICIIGAGEIGSRHLQALARVTTPLRIFVIDPQETSLKAAAGRYKEIPEAAPHRVTYEQAVPTHLPPLDIAIVATTSAHRRLAIESLLRQTSVSTFILEKLLFDRRDDYTAVAKLLEEHDSRACVNCMMRTIPFFRDLKKRTTDPRLTYIVNRTDTNISTSAIHYLDHIAYLTGDTDFTVDTTFLDNTLVASKRKGFIDVTGSLRCTFKNGTVCIFNRDARVECPPEIIIYDTDIHVLAKEAEGKALVAERKDGWRWKEEEAAIPFQSTMTTGVVEEILTRGTSPLVDFVDAVKLHIPLLDALLAFVNNCAEQRYDHYPFT